MIPYSSNTDDAHLTVETNGNGVSARVDVFETSFGGGYLRYNGSVNDIFIGSKSSSSGTDVDAIRIDRGSPNVAVLGTLSKAAGTLLIDHPLDPTGMILRHSFVESPDMMNVYNGNAVLNATGETVVILPAYFEALNVDYRYQLTAIGSPAQLYVKHEVAGNRFTIAAA